MTSSGPSGPPKESTQQRLAVRAAGGRGSAAVVADGERGVPPAAAGATPLARLTLSGCRHHTPTAWNPPSTCTISPVVAGNQSDSSATTALPRGLGVGDRPAQRCPALPRLLELHAAGDRLHRHAAQRPGGDQVDPDAARAELAGQVAAGRLQRRLGRAHPAVRPARRRWRRRSARRPTTGSPNSGRQAWASEAEDHADTWNAVAACSHGDLGEAVAHRLLRGEADRVDDAVEAVDVLAQPVGQRRQVLGVGDVELDDGRLLRQPLGDPLAQRQAGRSWTARRWRPAPARACAAANAIDASVSTPVTRIFLPSRIAHQCPIPSPPSTGTTAPVM